MFSALLLVSLGGIQVGGTSTCPTPGEVGERLLALSPATMDPRVVFSATLTQVGSAVGVELRGADGELVAERQLAGGSSCEELAAATSVMLLSWAREYEQSVAAPPPEPMPDRDLDGRVEEPKELADRPKSLLAFDVHAGISASLAAGNLAIGGLVGGAVTPIGSRFGGGGTLLVLGARPGIGATGTWERFALALGPHYRLDFGPVALDFRAEALAGILYAVPEDRTASNAAFDPGIAGGVRLLGRAGFFADLRAIGWPLERTFPGGGPLPRFEAMLALGLAWSSP